MAWRVTFDFTNRPEVTAKEAAETLSKMFRELSPEMEEWHCPEITNGLTHFGEFWEKGYRVLMVRFAGDWPEVIEESKRQGIPAEED